MALGHWATDYLGPHEADGSGGVVNIPLVDLGSGSLQLGATAGEIFETLNNGSAVFAVHTIENGGRVFTDCFIISRAAYNTLNSQYEIRAIGLSDGNVAAFVFNADGPDEYPIMGGGSD